MGESIIEIISGLTYSATVLQFALNGMKNGRPHSKIQRIPQPSDICVEMPSQWESFSSRMYKTWKFRVKFKQRS